MSGALIGQLEERRAELIASGREMLDRSRASDRALTAEETARSDRQIAEVREIDVRLGQLREQAEREQRAQLAYIGGSHVANDHGSGARPGGHAGDAMQIRASNRLQRGQTMRQYLAQRIQSERLAGGGSGVGQSPGRLPVDGLLDPHRQPWGEWVSPFHGAHAVTGTGHELITHALTSSVGLGAEWSARPYRGMVKRSGGTTQALSVVNPLA
jgi:hypothetical protein